MKASASSRRNLRAIANRLTLLSAAVGIAPSLHATSLFWDANGSLGGSGTWDTTSMLWSTTNAAGTPNATWTPNDGTLDAFFGGTPAFTVTAQTINANSLNFAAPTNIAITLTGGAITLFSPTATINMNSTATASVFSSIGGSDITVINTLTGTKATQLNLGGSNSFTGNLILAGGGVTSSFSSANKVNIIASGALPSTASVQFVRDFSQLDFAAGTAAYQASFSNNINLNASGSGTLDSGIGIGTAGTVVTLAGVISGSANLTFGAGSSGGSGKVVLTNHETYTGSTASQQGASSTIALGIDNALPTGTTFTMGNSSGAGSGTFDLAGFNQTLAGIASAGIGNVGSITNTSPSKISVLTISGSATTSFGVASGNTAAAANIGIPTNGITVPGASDNIALNLDANNTGQLTLVRPAGNSYNGGTTISGGTLLISNTSGSGTGTGPVTVGPNGKFGGNGIATGAVTTSGTILPGGPNTVGTVTFSGGLTANAGSAFTFEFNGSNDNVAMGSSSITVPAVAGSVALNLYDLSNSITASNTYTLFTGSSLAGTNLAAFNPRILSGPADNATLSLSKDGSGIYVSVSGTMGSAKTWAGSVNSTSTWDMNNTAAFSSATGSPATFGPGDIATFDDTNGSDATINIAAGGVSPGNTIITGTHNYTFNGSINSGGVSVSASSETVVLAGNNTYSGGTTVSAGTLEIASEAALGSDTGGEPFNLVLIKSATTNTTFLKFDADMSLDANRSIRLAQTIGGGGPAIDTNGHNVTIAGNITGSTGGANLNKVGTGVLYLRGVNSGASGGGNFNALNITNGFVNVVTDANFGKSAGASVTLDGMQSPTGTLSGLQLGGSFTWNVNRTINAQADSIGGGGAIDTFGFDETITSTIAGKGFLVKTGNGTLTYTGGNTNTGDWYAAGGTLAVSDANFTGGSNVYPNSFNVTSGGTLKSNGVLTISTPFTAAGGSVDGGSGGMTIGGTGNTTLNGGLTVAGGTVTFNRAGGTVTVAAGSSITVASGATANFNGATSIFTDGTNFADLAVNGTANLGGDRAIGNLSGASSGILNTNAHALAINQSANSIYAGTLSANGSAITKNLGGSLTVNNVRADSLTVNAGTVAIAPTLVSGNSVGVKGDNAGTSVLNGLNIVSGATMDLGNHSLIVNYTPGNSPAANIRAALVSAYNGGAWNQPGLTSSVAAADSNHSTALGYAEASDLGVVGGSFGGQPVTGQAVLVKYTDYGDSNLDGKVNLDDFSIFIDGFNHLGSGWIYGDYNYDGNVDQADFALFVQGYNITANNGPSLSQLILSDSELSASQKSALLSVVPEPTSLGIFAIGAGAMAMRRRRKM